MKYDLVLDCSVTMGWCFEDEISEYSNRVLDLLSSAQAVVPTIWSLEVANVLLIAERKKRITFQQVERFTETLSILPITIDHSTPSRAMGSLYNLAMQYHITIYDAAYLELALREKIPLATHDKGLQKAAKKMNVLHQF